METGTLLENRQGRFYDEWESLADLERDRRIRDRLHEIVGFARARALFYQERLEGYDPMATKPLARVPVLASDELRLNLPPQSDALLTEKNGAYTVFQSGGTTGMPKTSLFTHGELEGINRCNARGFFSVGLAQEDRVANLWAVGGLYMTFIHINRMLQNYGCMSFPFSNQTPADFILTVAKHFQINCFTGITSVVLNTLREIDAKEPGAIQVEKIYFGGEHIYDSDRQEMAERFGTKAIFAPGYGTVDSWYIGYQCAFSQNGVFHAFDDYVYLEILDEESGCAAPRGKIGMLHVTAFQRRLTPIIRYRVGDRARWLQEPCVCGRTTPLFQLLGRGDDVLRVGYDSVDYTWVQGLVGKIPGLNGRVQIEKQRERGRDRLILRAEALADPAQHAAICTSIETAFLEERPSFREFVKKGTVFPLTIELCSVNGLPRNPRTGKLIRVIDAI